MTSSKNIIAVFMAVLFCCCWYCDGGNNNLCTNATTSQGTKSFVGLIFKQYTSSNLTAKLNKSVFNKLLSKLVIGHPVFRHTASPNAMAVELAGGTAGGGNITNEVIGGKKCYSIETLAAYHRINVSKGISKEDFIRICPSLVQQIQSEVCIKYHGGDTDSHTPKSVQTWGYGFISITIISLLSLVVIAMIPCLKKSFYTRVMTYLVALAVGTLSGDAMLHLIPHAFGEGSNAAVGLRVSEKEELKQAYAQLMKIRGGGHGHSHGGGTDEENHGHHHMHETASNQGTIYENKSTADDNAVTIQAPHDTAPPGDYKRRQSLRDPGEKAITKETSIATVAWVVIVGDGFHNFSDGLAIGAAFSASVSSGVSTTIAVFCHELPHELGDFAVLLNAGMTVKQAILYNCVSTILAYLGLIIGILAGSNELGRHFILSITAGLFLYISLVDLLPELNNEDIPNQSKLCTFFIQNLGICTGIAIMLIISLYEHSI